MLLVGLNKVAPCLLCFFPFILTILTILLRVYQGLSPEPGVHVSHMLYADDLTLLTNDPVICKSC